MAKRVAKSQTSDDDQQVIVDGVVVSREDINQVKSTQAQVDGTDSADETVDVADDSQAGSTDTDNDTNHADGEFSYVAMSPAEVHERRRKLWTIGLILGGMVLAITLLITGLISYSVGYSAGLKDSGSNDSSTSYNSSSTGGESEKIPDSALAYQSQDKVGEGQIPDHYRGKQDAKVRVIEYADYNCSHCIDLAHHMDDIYSKYGDQVQFIFRHFGVGFANSDVTSKLAEAIYLVGGEDAYWKGSDKLFSDNDWSYASEEITGDQLNDKIRQYARDLGLDEQRLIDTYNDAANNGIQAKIDRDKQLGEDSYVSGTPTVIIDGEVVTGTADAITAKLDKLLN